MAEEMAVDRRRRRQEDGEGERLASMLGWQKPETCVWTAWINGCLVRAADDGDASGIFSRASIASVKVKDPN